MPPKRARAASPIADAQADPVPRRSTRVAAAAAPAIAPVPVKSASKVKATGDIPASPKAKKPKAATKLKVDDTAEAEDKVEPKAKAKAKPKAKAAPPPSSPSPSPPSPIDAKKKKPEAKKDSKKKAVDAKSADVAKANANISTTVDVDDDEEEDEPPVTPSIVKSIKKNSVAIDSGVPSHISTSYHVLQQNGVIYDALLNQTDIGNNNNKFFVIQVLKHDSSERYITWTRWGRVGNAGQSQQPEFTTALSAIALFESKFYDKTSNRWNNRENFSKVAKKYYLLERDHGNDDDTNEEDVGVGVKSLEATVKYPESKLPSPVQDLVKLIFNMDLMEKEMSEIGYDAKKMPLGKLTKRTIQNGYAELQKISEELNRPEGARRPVLQQLSSDFYTIIPHSFGMRVPDIIDTAQLLNQKLKMVEALGDIQITTTLLNSLQKGDKSVNPLDSKFDSLKIGMKPVDKSSDTFKLVETYTANTHGHTHSYYKLKVEKEDSFEKVGAKLHNRKLLWHGSRITNFVGILSQGLRIAPPEAPVTGYMFGKGVYFADMVSKSANYCCTSRQNPTGLLLLCEVALGDENQLINSDYHADQLLKKNKKHSTWGMGRTIPDPAGSITLSDGVIVPCGKSTTSPGNKSLQYNEFICYDIAQVKLKYLVKMNFQY
ncbi:Poly [ADP-ribose] polymerase 2 [Physocladia obscura]|uniref:Poly [ADP-ribose] polymerase n=1 Tax=Physocladia obscura TaxID=109957 RepID=A0AAD5XA78_9FUNG|nr:Poly [ADP-ribose] polymerase 2 [Physocladia obscura]